VLIPQLAAIVLVVAAGPAWAQAPVELGVEPFGHVDRVSGAATVTGTVTCPSGSTATVSGSLSQRKGHRTTTAGTFLNPLDVSCNGAAQQWSIAFVPLAARFKGGRADVSVDAVACLSTGCSADHADRRLILRG
jgi:hypothetical protein